MTTCYAANSKPARRRAMFHIKSDSAMFDNIAVPSGNGSSARVGTACAIGFFSLPWHGSQMPRPISKSK